ncbi:MAG TPA: TfoX/Sxy family protein [Longimicrobium sp.]|nr:TfoX/Sxy family protein [Longimicrobium sp.]
MHPQPVTGPVKSEIERMRNLGPACARWLEAIGVRTEAELRRMGPVDAYRLLVLRGYRPTLNLVWAIEGALRGVHWMEIGDEDKARLRAELEAPWDAAALLEDVQDGDG